MNKLLDVFLNMNQLGEAAMNDTIIHRLHPLVKIIGCLLGIICVLISYSVIELGIYFIIIYVISIYSKLSFIKLIKRGMVGLPFSLCLGISYLFINNQIVVYYGVIIREGILLCILILCKTFLCLCMSYLLIATTSFDMIVAELIQIKIPAFFVTQLVMTYRYIFTFLKEAKYMAESYTLRNPLSHGIEMRHMGSFIGHLLVKSMKTSQSVYQSMKCRGYDIYTSYKDVIPFESEHFFLLLMVVSVMIIIKVVSI